MQAAQHQEQREFAFDVFDGIHPELVKKFFAFHDAHPHIYRLFKVYCEAEIFRGNKRIGAKAIFERLRYEPSIQTHEFKFKLNNSYVSCYVRMLISEEPLFREFFEIRSKESETN